MEDSQVQGILNGCFYRRDLPIMCSVVPAPPLSIYRLATKSHLFRKGSRFLEWHLAVPSDWRFCHKDRLDCPDDGCVPTHVIQIAIQISLCAEVARASSSRKQTQPGQVRVAKQFMYEKSVIYDRGDRHGHMYCWRGTCWHQKSCEHHQRCAPCAVGLAFNTDNPPS